MINARFTLMVEDLFSTWISYSSLQLTLRKKQGMCALYISYECSITPRYFVPLVQAKFFLKIFSGRILRR